MGAKAKGIHADDLPQAQNLVIREWSHLSRKCAAVFTDAYVRRLVELTPRLKLRRRRAAAAHPRRLRAAERRVALGFEANCTHPEIAAAARSRCGERDEHGGRPMNAER